MEQILETLETLADEDALKIVEKVKNKSLKASSLNVR